MENKGSLITVDDTCLGYLMNFERGIYDATLGKVEVTAEEAEIHNSLLDKALVDGLDGCKVGQGGTFYLRDGQVVTFLGEPVAAATYQGRSVTFRRGGKVFRGRASSQHDAFNFRRVS